MSLASVIVYAHSMVGIPYISGGNDPLNGFDCSGLVLELLRAAGEMDRRDMTAQQLYDEFVNRGQHGYDAPGTLVFYGKSVAEISHVAFMITPYQIIEAAGGDKTTKTLDDAKKRGSFVRMRHVSHRKNEIVAKIRPYYAQIGMLQP